MDKVLRAVLVAHGGLKNWQRPPKSLLDYPVGLVAWIFDHDARSHELIARVFDGQPEGYARRCARHHALYWQGPRRPFLVY